MKRISIFVPENAVIEAITPAYRTFKTANEFLMGSGKQPFFTVEYVGLKKHISANDGEYTINIDRLLNEVDRTDLVVLPALYGDVSEALNKNKEAIPWIKRMYAGGSEVASLCIGAFLLAEAGLVNHRKCSTHWAYYDLFRKKFPDVEIADGSVITDEGRLYSSGGANSLWNLLLYLLEKYTDRHIAILTAKYFALDIDRNSQANFTIFTGQKDHGDAVILASQLYIEEEYSSKITVELLAQRSIMSKRSFERRFKLATNNTPNEYIQRVRIEAAKRSFESRHKNVSEVMYDVGYSDTKAFREVFRKVTGLTPIEYRNKYARFEILNVG